VPKVENQTGVFHTPLVPDADGMAATVHLLCGPAGSGKTETLLERFRSRCRRAPGTALWLGPTRRAVDALRERLLRGPGVCFAPHLLTFQDFADALVRANDPAARPLSDAQRRLLTDDIVADLHLRGELSHFARVAETRGFAEGVFALLAELKRNEILPTEFARAAYHRGEGGRTIGAKERQCARLYAQYQRHLSRHHLYDPEGRIWYARDLLARGVCRPFEAVRCAVVDGFTDFTRTQHDILAALCRILDELWITLPDEAGDERADLFLRPRVSRARLDALKPQVEVVRAPTDLHTAGASALPAGLAHLERQLFRPLHAVQTSADAEGISCLAAPGLVGEARRVARRVKDLLLGGVAAEEIVITMRDLLPYADLLREVFGEYGIPLDVEGTEPLTRNPAVATLLRVLRLPDEDWPFAGVTALLRSTYFRPDWPEVQAEPDVAQHAEVLLRLLGEPRGRAAYLEAVRRWAESPPEGLEDEQAEESRRRRTHELARKCGPFLQRFFRAWDEEPEQGTLADFAAWLERFRADLGLTEAGALALRRLGDELGQWLRTERLLHPEGRVRKRKEFHRMLLALAAQSGLARTPRGPGRVRVLSAELARGLEVPYLFVMGLGERSFPRLVAPEPLFDEQERQAFRQAGLDFVCVGDLMPDEMLLFYQVVTRARRQLVLSYPAVDDKGQELLASAFLNAVRECFTPGAVPEERRRMLIEGYDREPPRSPAEYRVQTAAAGLLTRPGLPVDLAENLAAAAAIAQQRFEAREHGPYDGLLRHAGVVTDLGQLFKPERVLSPTALEEYIACPFRFFLRHVLRLEPLEEPSEEIESTRRGQAFHRALSRLHQQLRAADVHHPAEEVNARLAERLAEAVEEYVVRAPSPASKQLWRLEGRRLLRVGTRYRRQWQKFLEPWQPQGVAPRPHFFEVDFGLPASDGTPSAEPLVIRVDGVEVRISGRIDRVDLAELPDGVGFWIIDYKTGNPAHYTGIDLRAFRRLQLTLYALAVERVLLAGQNARPLGLAYWLVADSGPKPALPGPGRQQLSWLGTTEGWLLVREQLERWVTTLVAHIRRGAFPLKPRSEHCTATCDFAEVCRISQVRAAVEKKAWQLPLPVIEERTQP
jgi:ATP-dependent helicase/DNAse subunit B